MRWGREAAPVEEQEDDDDERPDMAPLRPRSGSGIGETESSRPGPLAAVRHVIFQRKKPSYTGYKTVIAASLRFYQRKGML
ncbi:unnamed protein product [Urochloa humidicola]